MHAVRTVRPAIPRSQKRTIGAATCAADTVVTAPYLTSWSCVKRVIIVGPGASGKSTLAARLAEMTGLPVIELDKLFWRPGLTATPGDQWADVQRQLAARESWIMDGDLGPYDILDIRMQAADTIVFLDFSPLRCAWRAIRRSRERADFWKWLLTYRCRCRPLSLRANAGLAGDAYIYLLRTPRAVRRFCTTMNSTRPGSP